MNWGEMWSRRARTEIDGELATILAGPPPGTLGMTGGFPNPATFATELLVEIAARLVRDEPGSRSSTPPARASRASASTCSIASNHSRADDPSGVSWA